jgi:hypothetical protein
MVGPDELVGDYSHHGDSIPTGITPAGQFLFSSGLSGPVMNPTGLAAGPAMAGDPGIGVVALDIAGGGAGGVPGPLTFEAFNTSGVALAPLQAIGPTTDTVGADQAFPTPTGYHLEWVTYGGGATSLWQADVSGTSGQVVPGSLVSGPGASILPYASTLVGGQTFTITDNQAQLDGQPAVTIPGESPLAMSEVVASGLAGLDESGVAWADSGTAYAAVYNGATNSFGAPVVLDSGGSGQLHVVSLPDGDFVVSWRQGTQYLGEVFDPAGVGGGVMPLAGQVMGIDGAGELVTAITANGQPIVGYAISNPASTVYTSDASYTAPDGITSIFPTGAFQTIHGNNAGDTFWSDNSVNAFYGGTGNDTFHMGLGGDWAVGGGGSDTFEFNGIPWQAGGILDFGAGDTLDLSRLVATTAEPVTFGGFNLGLLMLTDDGAGDTGVWARYAPGPDGNWVLVTTLYGISPSSLDAHGSLVTLASTADAVTTSASDYVAPSYATSITLTGSNQIIDASATDGVTINSNDTGNALYGGPGDDTFHMGRGGDWAQGGGGADTFSFAAIPWAAGGITDFNAAQGDKIDLTGLLANAGFTGADPFAAGYLMYGTDSAGNAEILADYNQPGNNGWWLVTTLDGVSTSSLHYSGGMIT